MIDSIHPLHLTNFKEQPTFVLHPCVFKRMQIYKCFVEILPHLCLTASYWIEFEYNERSNKASPLPASVLEIKKILLTL